MAWLYNLASKLYIDPNGVPMTQDTLNDVRDQYLDAMDSLVDDYATNLETGDWTVGQFEGEMRKRLKNAYIAEYVLGKGGASQMTQSDYGRLGAMLKKQYKFLRSYLDDITAGKETNGTARERGKNFIGSARQAFSRGRGRAYGLDLPFHPGDGGTPCHGNCRCSWEIEEDHTQWRAYWHVTANKPCVGCIARQGEASPYVQDKESGEE
jgi:hypothetical protein